MIKYLTTLALISSVNAIAGTDTAPSEQTYPELTTKHESIIINKDNNPDLIQEGLHLATFFEWAADKDREYFFQIVKDNFPIPDEDEKVRLYSFAKDYLDLTTRNIAMRNVSVCQKVRNAHAADKKLSNTAIKVAIAIKQQTQNEQYLKVKQDFINEFTPKTVKAVREFADRFGISQVRFDYLSQTDGKQAHAYFDVYKKVCGIEK